jgi:hypothetical protein
MAVKTVRGRLNEADTTLITGRKWESRLIEPPSCRLVGNTDIRAGSTKLPLGRLYGNLPKTQIDLSRSMSDSADFTN